MQKWASLAKLETWFNMLQDEHLLLLTCKICADTAENGPPQIRQLIFGKFGVASARTSANQSPTVLRLPFGRFLQHVGLILANRSVVDSVAAKDECRCVSGLAS